MQVEAQDVLEVGEAVVAAEAHVVAKEGEHQRVAERLRHDREIHARHARTKGQPAEHERQERGRQRHHEEREPEVIESQPEPRQFLPVEEDHEVRQDRIAVHAARADLAHEIHAHGVAAQGKERGVAEAQDAAESPDEIDGERQHRVAQMYLPMRVSAYVDRCSGEVAGTTRLSSGTRIATPASTAKNTIPPRSAVCVIHPWRRTRCTSSLYPLMACHSTQLLTVICWPRQRSGR